VIHPFLPEVKKSIFGLAQTSEISKCFFIYFKLSLLGNQKDVKHDILLKFVL
jgi:hypothetical protein